MSPLRTRNIIIIAALILGGAIALELYINNTTNVISYQPTGFNSTGLSTPRHFNYYKNGALIGTYEYLTTAETAGSTTVYTLNSAVNVTYQGQHLSVNTTYRFRDAVTPLGYSVQFKLDGSTSYLNCSFLAGNAKIFSARQGQNQTINALMPSNTVLIDNNNPAHWEILMRSFNSQIGARYSVGALVPQGGGVTSLEYGVDSNKQSLPFGSKSYLCTVGREPNLQITLTFYQGDLLEYRNDADGLIIVRNDL